MDKQPIRNYVSSRKLQYLIVGLIIVMILAASFFVLYGIPAEAYVQYSLSSSVQLNVVPVQLNVPFCDQDESINNQYKLPGICWDTSAEMILNYWHNQGYLTSVPTQGEIYSDTMSYSKTGNLDDALASLGFYCAEFNPQQTLYTSYRDYQQQNNALSANQMIQTIQLALSLGAPLEATVETQPYPQATVSTGGILCDSRGDDHAIVITGYNQTGFIFNSATNEEFNPIFVSNDSLNTYAYDGRVVNGYELYCPYSEFIAAYNHEMWGFMAVFPLNYTPILCQQTVQLLDKNSNPISGTLVSSPFSSATTNSYGYATLTITDLGTPISVGYDMQAYSNRSYCGQYNENLYIELGYSTYMLYPTTNAYGQTISNYTQMEMTATPAATLRNSNMFQVAGIRFTPDEIVSLTLYNGTSSVFNLNNLSVDYVGSIKETEIIPTCISGANYDITAAGLTSNVTVTVVNYAVPTSPSSKTPKYLENASFRSQKPKTSPGRTTHSLPL